MSGVKRKDAPADPLKKTRKKQKTSGAKVAKTSKDSKAAKYTGPVRKPSRLQAAAEDDGDDNDETEGAPFPPNTNGDFAKDRNHAREESRPDKKQGEHDGSASNGNPKQFKLDTSSAEAHAKQRALAKERKANKPNADVIQRSKHLWERLRRKSHVQKEERVKLLSELFELIDGKVRDFVFKHDSVRVIQCAIKYARSEQLKKILQELKGDIRDLVESRYGKFLVAKMVVQGDRADKDAIIPAFYGQVKRLVNHPEASWIVDDIYRQVATPRQKAIMLREWYGAEFAIAHRTKAVTADEEVTADLSKLLAQNPEKRKPILVYLHQMINNLIQKKMTGFTMLHDAMLQYFLALGEGSEERSDFMEILKGDIDAEEEGGGGDLFRNLAFTESGSHLVCLVLAYGSAKDRKVILKCFKDNIELMAFDQYAKMVLVVGLDVTDDTRLTNQSILRELLGLQNEDSESRLDRLEGIITSSTARVPVLFPLTGPSKWLLKDDERRLIDEVHNIRETTSKKAPEIRRKELITHISGPLLDLVAERAGSLVQSSFACQPITEILLECTGEQQQSAKEAVANLAEGELDDKNHVCKDPAASRMLKTLVYGGKFDPSTACIQLAEPRLGFGETLYPIIKPQLVDWACSNSSFVAVALLDSEDVPQDIKKEVKVSFQKNIKRITTAAESSNDTGSRETKKVNDKKNGNAKKEDPAQKGNAGARQILEKL